MLFISDIENGTENDMVLMICLQRHTRAFSYITAYEGKFLKHMLEFLYWPNFNEIDMSHLDIQKYVSYEKWFK